MHLRKSKKRRPYPHTGKVSIPEKLTGCKRDLFSNELEVLGLLKLTPIPGYAGTFPVFGESERMVQSLML